MQKRHIAYKIARTAPHRIKSESPKSRLSGDNLPRSLELVPSRGGLEDGRTVFVAQCFEALGLGSRAVPFENTPWVGSWNVNPGGRARRNP